MLLISGLGMLLISGLGLGMLLISGLGLGMLLISGLGLGMLLICIIACVFYNMIIAWSLYFVFASFTSELPWSHCRNDFNTDRKHQRSTSSAGPYDMVCTCPIVQNFL